MVAAAVLAAREALLRPREVLPGEVYRSGQVSSRRLESVLRSLGIAAVIDLTAAGGDSPRWAEETALCARMGVEHLNLGLRVSDWLPQHRVRTFVDAVDSMGRPILVHCLDGHDRSGWAAASARLLAGHELDDALTELSPLRGHLCRRSACLLHRFFDQYESYLDEGRQRHSAAIFRLWASSVYAPEPYHAELTLIGAPPAVVMMAETVRLGVRVVNLGATAWTSPVEGSGVRLGARLFGPVVEPPPDPVAPFRGFGGPVRDVGRAEIRGGRVATGEAQELVLAFPLDAAPGSYLLQVDMVDEGVHWFSDVGGPGLILELEVVRP